MYAFSRRMCTVSKKMVKMCYFFNSSNLYKKKGGDITISQGKDTSN